MKRISKTKDAIFGVCTKPNHLFSVSVATLMLSACGGGGEGDGGTPAPPPPPTNTPPSVTTDERKLVSASDAITLTASATDAEADTISYSWQQQNGESVANTQGFNTATASFNAPDKVDTLIFRVTATAAGQSDTADVTVIVVEDTKTAIFIDADFTGTSDGSIDAPLTDLAQAITDTDEDADFYLQTPDNDAAYILWTDSTFVPSIRDGKSIYGGYKDDWSKDTTNNLTPITAERLGLVFRDVDQVTTVSGLDLTITQPTQSSTANHIGILVSNGSSEFILENNKITVEGFVETDPATAQGSSIFGFYTLDVDTVRAFANTISTGMGSSASNIGLRSSAGVINGGDGGDASVGNNEFGGTSGGGGDGWNGGKGGNAGDGFNEDGSNGSDGGGRTSPVIVTAGTGGRGGEAADAFRTGRNAADGGIGGRGGSGGAGGSGGGGPSFGIFIGANTPATIEENTITTGNGGKGGGANFTDELNSAGDGGWSVAIFDGDLGDSLTPTVTNNTITLGLPGSDGNPRDGQGTAVETNF